MEHLKPVRTFSGVNAVDYDDLTTVKQVFSSKIYVFLIRKLIKISSKTNNINHNFVVTKYCFCLYEKSRDSENAEKQVFTHRGYPKIRRRRGGKCEFFQNLKFDVGLNWIWKIIILASWKNVFYFFKNKKHFKIFQKIFS